LQKGKDAMHLGKRRNMLEEKEEMSGNNKKVGKLSKK